MQKVTIHAAKARLSRLNEAALAGEEIVIARGDKPVVRLVPIPQGKVQVRRSGAGLAWRRAGFPRAHERRRVPQLGRPVLTTLLLDTHA
jgi:antitoxin (DNA-binding transcriptional repressor) of toxin-antitoxin stability system